MYNLQVINRACTELDGMHFQVYDPLNYMASVHLPFEMREESRQWVLTYAAGCLTEIQYLCSRIYVTNYSN